MLQVFQTRLKEIDEDLEHGRVCLSLAHIVPWNEDEKQEIVDLMNYIAAERTEIIIKIVMTTFIRKSSSLRQF